MSKRNVYILLSEECEILATETSLKKIVDKFGDKYGLLSYKYLSELLGKARSEKDRAEFEFTGKEGGNYKLAARRIQ